MKNIQYIINEKGEKTALLVNLENLKNSGMSGKDVTSFLEDLEDIIAVELRKDETRKSYRQVRQEILKEGEH